MARTKKTTTVNNNVELKVTDENKVTVGFFDVWKGSAAELLGGPIDDRKLVNAGFKRLLSLALRESGLLDYKTVIRIDSKGNLTDGQAALLAAVYAQIPKEKAFRAILISGVDRSLCDGRDVRCSLASNAAHDTPGINFKSYTPVANLLKRFCKKVVCDQDMVEAIKGHLTELQLADQYFVGRSGITDYAYVRTAVLVAVMALGDQSEKLERVKNWSILMGYNGLGLTIGQAELKVMETSQALVARTGMFEYMTENTEKNKRRLVNDLTYSIMTYAYADSEKKTISMEETIKLVSDTAAEFYVATPSNSALKQTREARALRSKLSRGKTVSVITPANAVNRKNAKRSKSTAA